MLAGEAVVAIWNGIDLCTVEKIIIHYDKDADKTTADFE